MYHLPRDSTLQFIILNNLRFFDSPKRPRVTENTYETNECLKDGKNDELGRSLTLTDEPTSLEFQLTSLQ